MFMPAAKRLVVQNRVSGFERRCDAL